MDDLIFYLVALLIIIIASVIAAIIVIFVLRVKLRYMPFLACKLIETILKSTSKKEKDSQLFHQAGSLARTEAAWRPRSMR